MGPRVLDLDHPSNMTKFRMRVDACLYAQASRAALTETEERFMNQMKAQLDGREDNFEVTNRKWNPTVNQWNYLSGIFEKL